MVDRDDYLLDVANSSGFPLQIAVEHLVRNLSDHWWKIRYVEHAWKSQTDDLSGFIDLVLEDGNGTCIFVVECKRVRDSDWVFLRSDGKFTDRRHCKSWVSRYSAANGTKRVFGWHDVAVLPKSGEALFCCVRGQAGNGSRTMLERVAGELVASTEALAVEERDFGQRDAESIRFYFNVLVTTATLHQCHFLPEQINIADGMLPQGEFQEVPFIRFRKQLSLRLNPLTPEDFAQARTPNTNDDTVFIVNVNGLSQFLNQFDMKNEIAN